MSGFYVPNAGGPVGRHCAHNTVGTAGTLGHRHVPHAIAVFRVAAHQLRVRRRNVPQPGRRGDDFPAGGFELLQLLLLEDF